MRQFVLQVFLVGAAFLTHTSVTAQEPPLISDECGEDGCETEMDAHEGQWFELSARRQTGCIVVKESKVRAQRQLILGKCGDVKNAWRYNNGQFHSRLDDTMCMQAGRKPDPEGGRKMRLFSCDENKELQEFFHYEMTGHIKLKSNEKLCVEFEGKNANIDTDHIVLKECEDTVDGWTKTFDARV
jgi:hypothetical protein